MKHLTPEEIKGRAEEKHSLDDECIKTDEDLAYKSGLQLGYIQGFTDYQNMDRWIPVSERLPFGRLVKVKVCNMDAPEYNRHVFLAARFDQTKSFSADHNYIGTITHWKPCDELPDPPKQ